MSKMREEKQIVTIKMMTDFQDKLSDLLQPLLECAEGKRDIEEWNDHAFKLMEEADKLYSLAHSQGVKEERERCYQIAINTKSVIGRSPLAEQIAADINSLTPEKEE